eukprot:364313-Chlamydomonas_euryale.AAC.3
MSMLLAPTSFNVLSTIICKKTSYRPPRQAIWHSNSCQVGWCIDRSDLLHASHECREDGDHGGWTTHDLAYSSALWQRAALTCTGPLSSNSGYTGQSKPEHQQRISPNRFHIWHSLVLTVAEVANVVQPFLVCDRQSGSAVDPAYLMVLFAMRVIWRQEMWKCFAKIHCNRNSDCASTDVLKENALCGYAACIWQHKTCCSFAWVNEPLAGHNPDTGCCLQDQDQLTGSACSLLEIAREVAHWKWLRMWLAEDRSASGSLEMGAVLNGQVTGSREIDAAWLCNA